MKIKPNIYGWIVAGCIVCILLKLALPRLTSKQATSAAPLNAEAIAKKASLAQGKLVVARIYMTTTYHAADPGLAKARVAYIHDGSADIVVDLTMAEIEYIENPKATNLVIRLPEPKLDESTVEIDPSGMTRCHFVGKSSLRSDDVYNKLDAKCRKGIKKKEWDICSSVDLREEAKKQAFVILSNFYQSILNKNVAVQLEFYGTNETD